jgi:hypothetical protein
MVTFTRGSNATLVDSTGKITYAPANLVLQSQTFDNASWIKTRSSVTADATTSPDGTVNADKLVEDATAANNHFTSQSVTTTAIAYTFTVYAKAAERGYVTLINSTVASGCCFDLITGVVGVASGATPTASTITDVGNGWYRCSITVTATAASNAWRINVMASNSANTAYNGDGTSGIYIWGAQLEPVTYQTTAGPYVATTSAAYYGPRFDYDPVTLAAKGLLIEEARTNLLTYSEQFDNAAWIKTAGLVTANVATAPDGTSTMDAAANDIGVVRQVYQQVTAAVASIYTASVYLKAGTASSAGFTLRDATLGANLSITGVIVEGPGTLTATGSSSITVSGLSETEFTRVSVTLSSAAVAGNLLRFSIYPESVSSGGSTGKNVLIWGAQLEAGAFATSYIPTVASQVTRSADVATMTGTNFSSWYNQSEGTFVVGFDIVSPSNKWVYVANDGTATTYVGLDVASAGNARFRVVIGGVSQAGLSSAAVISANTIIKQAGAYANNSFNQAVDGVLNSGDTSGSVPTVLQFIIGAQSSLGGFLNGHIRQIAYYNTRLPNATLQALTEIPGAYSADYLAVAGGASGGSNDTNMGTGGGGAGGLLSGTSTLAAGTVYTVAVGAGGAVQSGNGNGLNGSNSSALGVTATGGGAGSGVNGGNGVAGGSGGGGSGSFGFATTSGGAGTSGQGFAGGNGQDSSVDADAQVGGGGGGASAVGSAGTGTSGGNGGAGTASSITGSSVTYAGGGGGGKRLAGTAGTGGAGGGGAGGAAANGTAGTANLGGGGGGAGTGGGGTVRTGGAGGSGVVILSVPTSKYTGTTTGSPTVTTSGANTIMTFTSSGSYTA